MNTEQIRKVFRDKKDTPCPITERLLKAGFQQAGGGYIKYAYASEIEVDYRKAEPTQWWHLIRSYCDRTKPQKVFGRSIVCGELIFWMAEVLECVSTDELNALADRIIASGVTKKRRNQSKPPMVYDRKKWNAEIQKLCFDKIQQAVEGAE